MTPQPQARCRGAYPRIERAAWIAGGVGLAGSVAAWLIRDSLFYEAWLLSWFYWFSIPVGCLGFFMVYRLTGGLWGGSLERILLAASRTMEALAVLFLPIVAGLRKLYPWTHADVLHSDPKLEHKAAYLNVPFWCLRTLVYLACLHLLSLALSRADRGSARRLSAGGLIAATLIVSFATIDWIMSMEPLWYSTVYSLMLIAGQGISGFAFALIVMHALRGLPGWAPPLSDKVLKDQGSLLFTTSAVWTYLSFVQWLIIWIGNEPETITWYVSRAQHGWATLAWIVVIGQFAIPFQLLLFQSFKRRTANLAALGLFLLLIRLLDIYWLVVPAAHPQGFLAIWAVVPAFLAIGGFWLAWFLRQLRTIEPASAETDCTARLREALSHG